MVARIRNAAGRDAHTTSAAAREDAARVVDAARMAARTRSNARVDAATMIAASKRRRARDAAGRDARKTSAAADAEAAVRWADAVRTAALFVRLSSPRYRRQP